MHLAALYQQFSDLARTNQMIAGAVSLWGLGVVTYIARYLPVRLWTFISTQSTTSVTFNNTGWWGNRTIFLSFAGWYKTNNGSHLSRVLSLDAGDKGGVVIGPGYGLHVFWADRRLFWFYKAKIEGKSDQGVQEIVTLVTLGRSRKPLERLIARFQPEEPDEDAVNVYSIGKDGAWDLTAMIAKRPFESVVLPQALKDRLTSELDQFYAMRDWYLQRGLPHKLCTLLWGKPGCGKTSLVKSLAAKYDRNVYILNLNDVTDRSLPIYLSKVPKGSFVLIEEVDAFHAVKDRVNASPSKSFIDDMAPLTLVGVLSALDGIVSLDNIVIFMTTNHKEQIDEAVLRAGRTDLTFELEYLTSVEVEAYIRYVYQREVSVNVRPIAGCDLQKLLLEFKLDFDGFHSALIDRYSVPNVRSVNAA